ncbi:hypothetical protein WMY93_032277 [Mugilogobius chulae]|uniref:Endothelin-1 n=1 Tax=Mugilogobius chulae TaxID=88201 RepID=A0AAW0MCE3_9GOBI
MDLYFLLYALLGTFSFALSSGLEASAVEASRSDSAGHVRTKRCSCATFLDKECVYFCHLDIIWVNTPERVVSYGLGNAPRSKRSVPLSSGPRCRCLRDDDQTCRSFCQREKQHRETSERSQSVHTQDKRKHETRLRHVQSGSDQTLSPELRAVIQTRTILDKWRQRRRNRSRSRQWETQSSAA